MTNTRKDKEREEVNDAVSESTATTPGLTVDVAGASPSPSVPPVTEDNPEATGVVKDDYSGRSKVVLRKRGKVTNEFGTFVLGVPQSVNAEAKKALLALADGHGKPLFAEV